MLVVPDNNENHAIMLIDNQRAFVSSLSKDAGEHDCSSN
jgi:hypothetical protein